MLNTVQTHNLGDLKHRLCRLAGEGVYFGTSSWKYAGWLDSVYTRDRYIWRGRFAASRFERLCLTEYAETFPTVCVDAAYYTFPTVAGLTALGDQVPEHFRFGFKVTGDITLKRFPVLDRFGLRAGRSYKQAVERFHPYARLQEPYPEGVKAGAQLARSALRDPRRRPLFIYVNNRFEGNAPQSIRRMLEAMDAAQG